MSASALSCPTAYGAPWTSAGPASPGPYGRLSALQRCLLLLMSMRESRCQEGEGMLTARPAKRLGKGKQGCQESGSRVGVQSRSTSGRQPRWRCSAEPRIDRAGASFGVSRSSRVSQNMLFGGCVWRRWCLQCPPGRQGVSSLYGRARPPHIGRAGGRAGHLARPSLCPTPNAQDRPEFASCASA
jgi:hypothetical protein